MSDLKKSFRKHVFEYIQGQQQQSPIQQTQIRLDIRATENGQVVVIFDRQINMLNLEPDQAESLGEALKKQALEARKRALKKGK